VLQTLANNRGENWILDVAGDGPELQECRDQVQQLQLSSQVNLRGHQANPTEWYGKADLLLFPSKLESMGLVLLESMAHGTPALVIREDGNRYRVPFSEVIKDNVTGLIANDEEDFQRRLADVIAEPNNLDSLSTRSRLALDSLSTHAQKLVQEHYTWDRHLNRFEEHIDELLGQHASSTTAQSACVTS
jgi:glycosyltransferase involved in cell wall biosynthesis